MGERRVRNAKVEGSIPFRSTTCSLAKQNLGLKLKIGPNPTSGSFRSTIFAPKSCLRTTLALCAARGSPSSPGSICCLNLPPLVHCAVNGDLQLVGTQVGVTYPLPLPQPLHLGGVAGVWRLSYSVLIRREVRIHEANSSCVPYAMRRLSRSRPQVPCRGLPRPKIYQTVAPAGATVSAVHL